MDKSEISHKINPGPSVYESARLRVEQIDRQMEALESERKRCVARLRDPNYSCMLECERLAMEAEPLQVNKLPENTNE